MALSHASYVQGYRLGSSTATNLLEIYLDFVCPYSKRAFDRLYKEVIPMAQQKFPQVAFQFRHQIQSWHPQTVPVHEAAMAVHDLDPSKFYPFAQLLFDHIEDFYDDKQWDVSRKDLNVYLSQLASQVGVDPKEFLNRVSRIEKPGEHNTGNACTTRLKIAMRITRQNGVHVSPTIVSNGLVYADYSSAWTLGDWEAFLTRLTGNQACYNPTTSEDGNRALSRTRKDLSCMSFFLSFNFVVMDRV